MLSPNSKPVSSIRRSTCPEKNYSSGPSTGLLINVIRTLTSSLSEDQRELEKTRLERGFRESETLIDRLVKEHRKDVEECLDSFRDISDRILTCRERIHGVRNALLTCKTLLECRRDDLKKLWLENSQQKYICEIMTQLDELKQTPLKVDALMNKRNYQEAAKIINSSRNILDRRMAKIEGLGHLRCILIKSSETLAEKIVEQIVQVLVVDPFEKHMFEVVRSMPEQKVMESEQCTRLANKAKLSSPPDSLYSRLSTAMSALTELEGGSMEVNKVMALSRGQINKQIASSVSLMYIRASMDNNLVGDQSHLTQLIQMVVCQLESSRAAHAVLAEITATYPSSLKVLPTYWEAAQSAVETLVSDHLDITPMVNKEPIETKKQLFRFDATAFANSTSGTNPATQNSMVVCQPSAFNMVAMFPWLRKLMDSIEKATGEAPCQLRRFVHSFVMELFVERVKAGLADRIETALKVTEGGRLRLGQNAKVLPSCERVLELCKEVYELIVSMDLYADRFAALWLLVLADYNKNVADMYEKTTRWMGEIEGIPSRRKISAAWAADEDISRLLMSLPNWQIAAASSSPNSPTTPAVESEREIRQRNERESEILIGNLGTQKHIEKAELVTDISDVRALAALHESLRWFAIEVRRLVSSLPENVKATLHSCVVQVRFKDGQVSDNEPVLAAMEDCVRRLESISDTCILMLHLELRVHCFFHLLPLSRLVKSGVHDEIDQEVLDLGHDLQSFHQLLSSILSHPKLRYIFDGLGHLCASIFIHSSQHMPRLSESAKKRVCRNVWGVQQRLSQITARREAELDRARAFFELLSYDTDRLMLLLPDRKSQFTAVELGHLVTLSVRSNPSLANQHGALDQRLAQLSSILKEPVM